LTALFEKLIDLFVNLYRFVIWWVVLDDDQVGLVRRLGKYHRDLHHGLNWKWPIIETTLSTTSALDSTMLREQSLTTADGKQVTLRGVLTYRVVNAQRYLIDVATTISVVNDVGCCVIAEMIPELTAAQILQGDEFNQNLLRRVRVRAKKWGIYVDSVGLADRVQARVYRFITSDSRNATGDGVPDV